MKTELKLLFVGAAFSALLLISRMIYTEQLTFVFLVWNLFLAAIPYVLSLLLTSGLRRWIKWPIGLLYILFLPNAPYIFTDLIHINGSLTQVVWFDSLMILSFAWTGMLFGLLSIRRLELYLRSRPVWTYLLLFLTAFGVYIGRFMRWNSWDILSTPTQLIGEVLSLLLYPTQHPRAWSMTLIFGALLCLIYYSVKQLTNLRSELVAIRLDE